MSFHTFKVRVSPTNILVTSREWASRNDNTLFSQDDNHMEVEVGKMTPKSTEWVSSFIEKNMTPSASLAHVLKKLENVHIANKFAFDPLLN